MKIRCSDLITIALAASLGAPLNPLCSGIAQAQSADSCRRARQGSALSGAELEQCLVQISNDPRSELMGYTARGYALYHLLVKLQSEQKLPAEFKNYPFEEFKKAVQQTSVHWTDIPLRLLMPAQDEARDDADDPLFPAKADDPAVRRVEAVNNRGLHTIIINIAGVRELLSNAAEYTRNPFHEYTKMALGEDEAYYFSSRLHVRFPTHLGEVFACSGGVVAEGGVPSYFSRLEVPITDLVDLPADAKVRVGTLAENDREEKGRERDSDKWIQIQPTLLAPVNGMPDARIGILFVRAYTSAQADDIENAMITGNIGPFPKKSKLVAPSALSYSLFPNRSLSAGSGLSGIGLGPYMERQLFQLGPKMKVVWLEYKCGRPQSLGIGIQ